jgi:hypothetical protein
MRAPPDPLAARVLALPDGPRRAVLGAVIARLAGSAWREVSRIAGGDRGVVIVRIGSKYYKLKPDPRNRDCVYFCWLAKLGGRPVWKTDYVSRAAHERARRILIKQPRRVEMWGVNRTGEHKHAARRCGLIDVDSCVRELLELIAFAARV